MSDEQQSRTENKEEYQSRTEKNKDRRQKGSLFRKKDNTESGPSQSGSAFDKIFYILIAFLFLLLIAVVIFIMNYNDSNTENVSEDLVQTESRDSIRDLFSNSNQSRDNGDEAEGQAEDQSQDDTDDAEAEDQTDEDEEEETDEDEETQGDLSIINEDPPHDPNHPTDYSDGSADRLEIRENVSTVTGIPENDLIENWIGNDGPGRVEATVTQASTGQQYVVYLQYGEGQWHVESVNPQ